MSPDLETLRAHADGELAPLRRAEVDAAIAADPALAALSAALFASRLPYRSVFERDAPPPPPLPAALQARIAELAAVARASELASLINTSELASLTDTSETLVLAGASAGSQHDATPPPASGRPARRWALLLLLSGVLLGCLLAAAVATVQQRQVEPWLRSVITYHAMYSRETVFDGDPALVQGQAQAQAVALRKALHDQQGLKLTVPDLRAQGLQFVRAQRLKFDGQQALAWHAEGWAYVLIGALPLKRLQALRQHLPAALI